MENRLERIDRDILSDGGTGGGLGFDDAVWLVDMVKAYQVYVDAMEMYHLNPKSQRRFSEMFAAQNVMRKVEDQR